MSEKLRRYSLAEIARMRHAFEYMNPYESPRYDRDFRHAEEVHRDHIEMLLRTAMIGGVSVEAVEAHAVQYGAERPYTPAEYEQYIAADGNMHQKVSKPSSGRFPFRPLIFAEVVATL